MTSAKERLLAAVRRNLPKGPVRALPEVVGSPSEVPDVERFQRMAESVGTRVHRAADAGELAALVKDLRMAHPGAWAASGAAARRTVGTESPDWVDPWDRRGLMQAAGGLTLAQWGIAESGTLVLDGRREDHRLVSLLPPIHVAILPRSRMLATLGHALAALAADGPLTGSAITFVTGPSRTADIELTLVVGVHGPSVLHVILLEDGEPV